MKYLIIRCFCEVEDMRTELMKKRMNNLTLQDGGRKTENKSEKDFFEIFKQNLKNFNFDLNDEFLKINRILEEEKPLSQNFEVTNFEMKGKILSIKHTPIKSSSKDKKLKSSLSKELDLFFEDFKINQEIPEEYNKKNSQETVKKHKKRIVLSPERSSLSGFYKVTPSKQGKKTPVDMIPKMLEELELNEGSDLMFTPKRKGSCLSPNIKTVKREYFKFQEENNIVNRTQTKIISIDILSDDIEEEEDDIEVGLGKRDHPEAEDKNEYQDNVRMRNLRKLGLGKTVKKLKKQGVS